MNGDELRLVVERQAEKVGLDFEPGLLATIMQDLRAEPGLMPLLQHCLRELWKLRHGRTLRLCRYRADDSILINSPSYQHVGGVQGAIARTAESAFRELQKHTPEAVNLLPYIFERLTRLPNIRRRLYRTDD